jgi:tryptophanyl-tRNA synthetase
MGDKSMTKQRILTGDTPTGKLHLGHWVGSVKNRVALQDEYDCYFLLANYHAFTTRADRSEEIRQSTLDITLDYLAAGIDPAKSTIMIQSEVPAIADLTFLFSMLLSYPRVMRNPTIKSEIRDKALGENYPFGFLLYPVGQVADILAFLPEMVPVGEDQIPHLEMAREVARKFNQLYCGVDSHLEDDEHLKAGGLFPIIKPLIGDAGRLVGLNGPDSEGRLLKMSKSLNNSILLSDDNDTVKRKIMRMYTDPNRIHPTDKGTVENNPLWIFHDTFNDDKVWVEETKDRYRNGQVGDVECKRKLIDVIVALLEPMHARRAEFVGHEDHLIDILKAGTEKANVVADATLKKTKAYIHQDYF